MDKKKSFIELALTGEEPKEEYLHMVMEVEDYVEYDDADLYGYEEKY